MTLLFWLSLISLGLTLAIALEIALGIKKMTRVGDILPTPLDNPPPVSIIIPACNEAATIAPAMQSVLDLDYQNLEIIVVNDRSTDNTGEVLSQICRKHPQIKHYHVTDLPRGWLGKAHALQYGADRASGEYLLFTDADILFEKSTLTRAIRHVRQNQLDHLSIFFENIAPGGLLNGMLLDICGGLLLLFKPWKAKDKKSKRFMGVGAFNLVKTSAYREVDGHRSFSLHPIDDIMMGKVLKNRGFAQDCLLGHGFVQVKWYSSVRELINGIMKNSFAAYDFKVFYVLAGCLFIFVVSILPFWATFFTTGTTQLIFGAAVLSRLLAFTHGYSYLKFSPLNSFWALITPYLSFYMILKGMITTLKNGGINWRGTHYNLDDIKGQGRLY